MSNSNKKPENLVKLIEKKRDNISIYLSAEIKSDGSLVLEGQDLGSYVEDYWGDSDYEYWTYVPAEQKLTVLLHLIHDAFSNLLELCSWLESVDVQSTGEIHNTEAKEFTLDIDEDWILIYIDIKEPIFVIDRKEEDRLILLLLRDMFKRGIFNNDAEFMNWLKKNNIEYEFFSYA